MIKAYRVELQRARHHASVERQDELAGLAVKFCIDVLQERAEKCRCEPEGMTSAELAELCRKKKGGAVRGLCQACKRAHRALSVWLELEKMVTDRIKMDVDLMKLLLSRSPQEATHEPSSEPHVPAMSIVNAVYERRRALARTPENPAVRADGDV